MSDDIVDRLNGRYSVGPHLPNGEPEFGWRQFQATPVNKEAATIIEALRAALAVLVECGQCRACAQAADVALSLGRGDVRADTFLGVKAVDCVPLAFRNSEAPVKPITE